MSNKPNRQHYIPRVYLKQFQIDNTVHKSFIYCINVVDKFKRQIQRVGLNDSIFTIKKYYNHSSLENPYAIEQMFAQEIEPNYQIIVDCISKEESISTTTRELILEWIFVSKMRSPIFRDNHEDKLRFVKETIQNYKEGSNADINEEEIKKQARWGHLSTFIDEEKLQRMVDLFFPTLNAKHWKVLKTSEKVPFIGNDNPGFSPNVHPLFQQEFPFHHVTELNAHSIIYYVLSPKYCLEIMPFEKGTPLTACAMNIDIKFEEVSKEYVSFINAGTVYTSYKVVFSNNDVYLKSLLNRKSRQ